MSKRNKKLAEKIIQALKGPAPLNDNPGPLVREGTQSHSKKDRKAKGRVEARIVNPKMKWSEVKELGIESVKFWDDWVERRDGFRWNTNPDQLFHEWIAHGVRKDKIYEQNNKLKKQIRIRKAKLAKKRKKDKET